MLYYTICTSINLKFMVFLQQENESNVSKSNVTCVEPPRSMVWSEREACERQVTQIGTSACGATAVVNVFVSRLLSYLL